MALVPGPGPLALAATDATNYQVATGPTHGTCVHMTHGPTFGFAFCFLLFAVQQALAGSRELIMELIRELITNQGIPMESDGKGAEGRSLLVSAVRGHARGDRRTRGASSFESSKIATIKNNGGARHCSSALQSHSLDTFRRVTIGGFNLGISPGR